MEVRPEAVGEVRRERLGRGGVPEAAQHVVVDAQPGALAPRALLRLRVDPASLHRRAREVLGEMSCCSGVSDSLSPSLVFGPRVVKILKIYFSTFEVLNID